MDDLLLFLSIAIAVLAATGPALYLYLMILERGHNVFPRARRKLLAIDRGRGAG